MHPAAAGWHQGTHSATPWSSVISTMGTDVSFSSDPHDSGADLACRSECLVPGALIAVQQFATPGQEAATLTATWTESRSLNEIELEFSMCLSDDYSLIKLVVNSGDHDAENLRSADLKRGSSEPTH